MGGPDSSGQLQSMVAAGAKFAKLPMGSSLRSRHLLQGRDPRMNSNTG